MLPLYAVLNRITMVDKNCSHGTIHAENNSIQSLCAQSCIFFARTSIQSGCQSNFFIYPSHSFSRELKGILRTSCLFRRRRSDVEHNIATLSINYAAQLSSEQHEKVEMQKMQFASIHHSMIRATRRILSRLPFLPSWLIRNDDNSALKPVIAMLLRLAAAAACKQVDDMMEVRTYIENVVLIANDNKIIIKS